MAIAFSCNLAATPLPLVHPWQHTVGSCHAPVALRADWQKQLRRAHRELGFRHVRFHGILCDDMSTVVCRDGQWLYSFFNADQIFDFLLSIGMRPIVELSFMPSALASGTETVFHYRANITPPRDYREWEQLIRKLVSHWVARYGIEEVSLWLFEVWNEPNLRLFWTGGQQAYFRLYQATVHAIKHIDERLQVGGPATAQNAWIDDFIGYCEQNALAADFVSTHYYATDASSQFDAADTISQLEHAPADLMRERALQANAQARGRPLLYTEWNITPKQRDPLHDEAFGAALAVRIALSVDGLVDAYGYWTFSDIFEENALPNAPFHGGFGLLTLHGIAKPAYRAFQLMQRLGPSHLPIVGKHETVAVWAGSLSPGCRPSSSLLLLNQAMPRHAIRSETAQIRLSGAAGRSPRRVTIARIDADHCNPRAAWQALGEPEYLGAEDIDRISAAAALTDEAHAFSLDGETTLIEVALQPQSLASLRIEWSA
ncbi:hypothetical protein AB4Z48_34815 [Cupriavidus sp. 2TAF22]|uniref:GH39 family glycosyl hydrolase n=1 Tax=unclassified Cupriavidus TaxID=2640874 RepID=UPI003F8EA1C4